MNRIAQEAAFRLAVVRYAERHGPSQAAIKYRVSRMTVYHWRKRYDGTKESHRKDNEEFDASHKFDSFADFKRQLARHNRICNAFPMRPLGWDLPNEYLEKHLAQCNTGLTNLHISAKPITGMQVRKTIQKTYNPSSSSSDI